MPCCQAVPDPSARPSPLCVGAAWGAMDDQATVAYIAASAQSMLSEGYNFT